MSFWESIRLAFSGIWANKLRSGLTMLGIIIGIAAVITVMAIGETGQQLIITELESIGANLFSVRVDWNSEEEHTSRDLTIEDADHLVRLSPYIDKMVAITYAQDMVRGPDDQKNVFLTGTGSSFIDIRGNIEVVQGRFFTEIEDKEGRAVIVLEQELARELFGQINPLGQRVRIANTSAVVIGLVHEGKLQFDTSEQRHAFLPIRFLQRIYNNNYVSYLEGQAISKEVISQAMQQTVQYLNRKNNHTNHYRTDSLDQQMKEINQVTGIMRLVISSIAGISLIVGGIGVMNIMLVSVTERTREIGIRKALGARRKDILLQFLIESVIISLIGGGLGVVIGVGGAVLLALAWGAPPFISIKTILIAFIVSSAIGIFFGLYPANKAAKLDPIEALRYE